MIIGLLTAVAAAVCYGTGTVLQALGSRRSARQEAERGVRETGAPSLASTAKAAVTWEFILGLGLDFTGFALGVLASRLLPLFLSQTIISANLVITAVLSMKLLGIRLTPREWASIGALCGALVLLAAAAGPEGHKHTTTGEHAWLLGVAVLLVAGGALLVRRLGRSGAIVAGLLAGLGFGALGIAVRVLDGLSPFDPAKLVSDPALYAILIGGLGGMYLYTVALQIGSVNGAAAALVVGETVVPGAIGVFLLGDHSRAGLGWMVGVGFVVAVVSAVCVAVFGQAEQELAASHQEPAELATNQ